MSFCRTAVVVVADEVWVLAYQGPGSRHCVGHGELVVDARVPVEAEEKIVYGGGAEVNVEF